MKRKKFICKQDKQLSKKKKILMILKDQSAVISNINFLKKTLKNKFEYKKL